MNQEQVMGLIRQFLPVAAGVATTLGYVTPEQVGEVSARALAAAGPVIALWSAAWSLQSKTNKAIVASAIALKDQQGHRAVKRIECAATPAGVKLADSVPDVNVVAGP